MCQGQFQVYHLTLVVLSKDLSYKVARKWTSEQSLNSKQVRTMDRGQENANLIIQFFVVMLNFMKILNFYSICIL